MTASTTRELVVVSGYYGFGNLGDEAILEELVDELKRLVRPEHILVLSAQPGSTAAQFGVGSQDRMDIGALAGALKRCRLFVSGGGGLFQNTHSLGSVIYYGAQLLMARAFGAQSMIYAQGLGPLNGALAKIVTREAFKAAAAITVRDSASLALVEGWRLQAEQTADPVWCLAEKPLPESIEAQLNQWRSKSLIGISLRPSFNFKESHLQALVSALKASVPDDAHLILLPLQAEQDREILMQFQKLWEQNGPCECTLIDSQSLTHPSQWIALFGRLKLIVGMRLHALIMALKCGKAVVGINYDAKVSQLLTDCQQPGLNLQKEPPLAAWQETLSNAWRDQDKLSQTAMRKAEGAKKLACQNFSALATILNLQNQR